MYGLYLVYLLCCSVIMIFVCGCCGTRALQVLVLRVFVLAITLFLGCLVMDCGCLLLAFRCLLAF